MTAVLLLRVRRPSASLCYEDTQKRCELMLTRVQKESEAQERRAWRP